MKTIPFKAYVCRDYESIIGRSPAIKNIFDTLELIESYESPILLEGETGTGKELLAAAIQYNSSRKKRLPEIMETAVNSEMPCNL